MVSESYHGPMAQEIPDTGSGPGRLRIDKWLWAARFFKTRALAQQAIESGHVRLNDERIKSSKELRAGDRLVIRIGDLEWRVAVLQLSDRRGPASTARQLYLEAEESRLTRERRIEEKRVQADPGNGIKGRPTKRDRRLIHRFREGG